MIINIIVDINNLFSTVKSVEPVFPYYILFASEMWELLKLTSQIIVSVIDVIEVLLRLILCHAG